MKPRNRTHNLFVLSAILSLAFIGCDEIPHIDNFPHQPHVVEMELTCDMCHQLEEGRVTNPEFFACTTCHDADAEELASCNECHEKQNVEMKEESIISHKEMFASHLPDNWKDVKFNHAEHVDNDTEMCLGCHQNVKSTNHSTLKNLPTMEESMAFNKKHGISNECQVCHKRLNELTPPLSHDASWDRKHGMMKEFTNKERCLLCHEEATCTTCHRTQKPQSHTNLFRRKTHGIEAAFDRSTCFTCHRNDECETCHQMTASPIPAAGYHNPSAQCIACHAPGGSNRPPNRFLKLMPHRMMMGASAGKCLTCHQF